MKTAEEYKGISIKYWIDFDSGSIDTKEYENRIESLFKQAQTDAYNQALEDATEKAKVSLFDWINDGFKEFKQNSNHYSINDGTYVKIDEQSILKLKK
jgi:hypothetical protein